MKKFLILILLLPLFAMGQAPTDDSTKLVAPPTVGSFTMSSLYYRGGNTSNGQVGYLNTITGKWAQLITGYQFNHYTGTSTQALINAKQNTIALGTTSQYFRGDLSLATFPTGLPPTGTAGGDLTGTYPNPTINTINSITKSYYDFTSSGQTQLNARLSAANNFSDVANIYTSLYNLNGKTITNQIDFYGKQVVIIGDSYTYGAGATNNSRRYSTIFCGGVGAIEVNHGISGSTAEKRVPIDYQGAVNLLDRLSDIPTKTTSMALLVFEFGLNDMGQNGPNYTAANYITDYTTALNNALSKGWLPSQILMLAPAYIGTTGYNLFASISGNAAPTRAHHLQFVTATQTVANNFGTLYIDLFHDQFKNDTTLLAVDGVHPNDLGHAFIGNDLIKFFDGTLSVGNKVPTATATPLSSSMGGTYGSGAVGSDGNLKNIIYDDGTNKAGIGESLNYQEYQIYAGGHHAFTVGGVNYLDVSNTGIQTNGGLFTDNLSLVKINSGAVTGIVADNSGAASGTGQAFLFKYAGLQLGGLTHVYNGATWNLKLKMFSAGAETEVLDFDGVTKKATFAGNIAGVLPALGSTATNFLTTATAGSGNISYRTAAQVLTDIGGISNPMTTAGDGIYGASSGTPTRFAGNTTGTTKFLTQVSSGAPIYFDLLGGTNGWTGTNTFGASIYASSGIYTSNGTGIAFRNATNTFYNLVNGSATANRSNPLPDADGTIALTTQLPTHGNSTTTGTATTAVTVTIGSTMANTTYATSITPRDLLTAVNYFISAQTTTTFTVTFVTALTGSINFDWIINP